MLTFEYILVFWRKDEQACTAISVWHLLAFLSAAPNSVVITALVSFFFFFWTGVGESLPYLSSLTVFPGLLYLSAMVWTKLNTLPKVTMCLSSSKHNLIALIFWMLLHTQQIPKFCCLGNHFVFFEINVSNSDGIYEAFKLFLSANATLYSTYLCSLLFAIMLLLFQYFCGFCSVRLT